LKRRLEIGSDEIKKGFQVRIAPVFGLLFSSFGYFVQER
jgi:hypothetical protein